MKGRRTTAEHDDSGEVAIVSRDSEQRRGCNRRCSKIQDELPCIISVASLRLRSGNRSNLIMGHASKHSI